MQFDCCMLPVVPDGKLQVFRVDVDKRSDQRTCGLVVREKGAELDIDVLGTKGRGKGKVGQIGRGTWFLVDFVLAYPRKAEPRSYTHSRLLNFRFQVVEAPIESFFVRTITDQVVTALIFDNAFELEAV